MLKSFHSFFPSFWLFLHFFPSFTFTHKAQEAQKLTFQLHRLMEVERKAQKAFPPLSIEVNAKGKVEETALTLRLAHAPTERRGKLT